MSSSTTAPEYTEFRGYWYGVEAPYWLVCAISAPLPIRWLLRRRRHRRRTAAGRCPTCGYDLRATPERCPECGTAVPAHAAGSKGSAEPSKLTADR